MFARKMLAVLGAVFAAASTVAAAAATTEANSSPDPSCSGMFGFAPTCSRGGFDNRLASREVVLAMYDRTSLDAATVAACPYLCVAVPLLSVHQCVGVSQGDVYDTLRTRIERDYGSITDENSCAFAKNVLKLGQKPPTSPGRRARSHLWVILVLGLLVGLALVAVIMLSQRRKMRMRAMHSKDATAPSYVPLESIYAWYRGDNNSYAAPAAEPGTRPFSAAPAYDAHGAAVPAYEPREPLFDSKEAATLSSMKRGAATARAQTPSNAGGSGN